MVRLVYVALALSLCLATAATADSRRIVQIAFMHRHGARTGPIVLPNGQLDFDEAVLTDVGVRMASALGIFLRRHYSNATAMNQRSPYFNDYTLFCNDIYKGPLPCINQTLDQEVIVSETTSFERTMRTGVGVVRGMFMQYNNSIGDFDADVLVVPYMPALPTGLDMKLGFYYSWPTAILHTPGPIGGYNANHNRQTLDIISQQEVDAVGAALFAGTSDAGQCATAQTLCVLAAQDIVSCAYSNAPNSSINATLYEYWPRFTEAQEYSNAFLYMFWGNGSTPNKEDIASGNTSLLNSTNSADMQVDYWNGAGPYGRVYAQATIARFRAALLGASSAANSDTGLIIHSSAHDVTLYGFLIAVGAIHISNYLTTPAQRQPDHPFDPTSESAYMLIPRYASMVVLELMSDGNVSIGMATGPQRYYENTSLGMEYSVTEHYSHYEWATNVFLACTDPAGKVAYASECSLDDLERTVQSMAPPIPYGPTTDNDAPKPPSANSFNVATNYSASGVVSTTDRLYLPDAPLSMAEDYSYCFRLLEDEALTQCQGESNVVPLSDNALQAVLASTEGLAALPLTAQTQKLALSLLEVRRAHSRQGPILDALLWAIANGSNSLPSKGLRDSNHRAVSAIEDAIGSNFCFQYRQVCPQFACTGPHFVLNTSNYACFWVINANGASSKEDDLSFFSMRHGVWFYVGTAGGSLLIGVVVGFIVAVAAAERRARTDAKEACLVAEEGHSQRSKTNQTVSTSNRSRGGSSTSSGSGLINADNARVRGFHKKPRKPTTPTEKTPLSRSKKRSSGSKSPVLSPNLVPSTNAFRPTLPVVDYNTPPSYNKESQLKTAPVTPQHTNNNLNTN